MPSFQRLRPPVRGGSPAPAAFRPRPFGEAPPSHHPPGADERHGFRFGAVEVPGAAPVQRAPLAAALTVPPGARRPVPAVSGEAATIQRVGGAFDQDTKDKIFEANKTASGGKYYTCSNGACGFQHEHRSYLLRASKKIQKRRVGDGGFHIDHIRAKSKGGKGRLKNGRVLCGTCNTSRGNRRNINMTGIMKFAGLHQGANPRVLTPKDYDKLKAAFAQGKSPSMI